MSRTLARCSATLVFPHPAGPVTSQMWWNPSVVESVEAAIVELKFAMGAAALCGVMPLATRSAAFGACCPGMGTLESYDSIAKQRLEGANEGENL